MARMKKDVIVCDVCGNQEITDEPKSRIDLDILGLTITGGFYAGPGGGGPLPEMFICRGCVDTMSVGDLAEISCQGIGDWKERRDGFH